jgi:N-methylhydantoinase A/oxoprolinase/acetone carboxylase beta subunit
VTTEGFRDILEIGRQDRAVETPGGGGWGV